MAKWGILGFGRMGLSFAEALKEVPNSQLISVGSESGKNFKEFKCNTYDEVINNESIDSIYISTLNNTHVSLINKVCKQKKNILCEKPVAMKSTELIEINETISKIKNNFYEAIAYYSHPQTIEVLKLVQNNEIGNIVKIECSFGFEAKFNPNSRLFSKELGGGAIYDLGCYPISFAMLFAQDIRIKKKDIQFSLSGVDDDAKATMICDDKFECEIHVSLKKNLKNFCNIIGSNGSIKINSPWLPGKNSQLEISNNKHFYIKNVKTNLSVYANQIKNVSSAFSGNNEKLNLFDINKSLINIKLIENWLKD